MLAYTTIDDAETTSPIIALVETLKAQQKTVK